MGGVGDVTRESGTAEFVGGAPHRPRVPRGDAHLGAGRRESSRHGPADPA